MSVRIPLMLLLLNACVAEAQEPTKSHGSPTYVKWANLSLTLPAGWTLQDTSFSVQDDFSKVLLLARNSAARNFIPQTRYWTRQLPDGAVVVIFMDYQHFPDLACDFFADTIGDSLASSPDRQRVDCRDAVQEAGYAFRFRKWNIPWEVLVRWVHPRPEDCLAVDSLLGSMVFHDFPVIDPGQAVQLAFRRLRPQVAHLGYSGAGREFSLNYAVKRTDSVFEVAISACDEAAQANGTAPGIPRQKWSYAIHPDGTVENLADER